MKRAVLLVLAALALIAAGCGGDDNGGGGSGGTLSKDEYVKQINEIGKTLNEKISALGSDLSSAGNDPKAIVPKLESGATALNQAAADLGELKAPDDVKDANAKLQSGVKALAGVFQQLADAAKSGDLQELLKVAQGLQSDPSIKQIEEAINEMKSKGYNVSSS